MVTSMPEEVDREAATLTRPVPPAYWIHSDASGFTAYPKRVASDIAHLRHFIALAELDRSLILKASLIFSSPSSLPSFSF